jgi:hypothetical protein
MLSETRQEENITQPSSPRLNRRELITYAFISQGIFGLNDRLMGLLPFFEPILRERQGSIFDPSEFAREVNARYPWSINADIAHFLIPRFVQAGWLRAWKTGEHEAAYAILSFPPLSDDPAFARAQETLSKIGCRFKEFIADVQPLFVTSYEQTELEELLLRWIVEKRAFDSSALLEAAKKFHQITDQDTETLSAAMKSTYVEGSLKI